MNGKIAGEVFEKLKKTMEKPGISGWCVQGAAIAHSATWPRFVHQFR